jgi:hypothetical protein
LEREIFLLGMFVIFIYAMYLHSGGCGYACLYAYVCVSWWYALALFVFYRALGYHSYDSISQHERSEDLNTKS